MHTRPITKIVIALASIFTLFALSATPAGAGGPYAFTITAGTLTANTDVFDMSSGGGGANAPCPPKASTTTITTNANGTWTIGGTSSTQFQIGGSGPWYMANITLAGNGTWTGASSPYTLATAAPNHLTFQARIYNAPPCDKSSLKCIITGRLAGAGNFTGTLPNANPGDSFTFAGSTANPGGLSMTATSCSAPFSAWHGQTASITGLTAVL